MLWVLFILLAILATAGIWLLIGNFVPHTTNMCVIDVKSSINQSFSAASKPAFYRETISGIGDIQFVQGRVEDPGSVIQVNTGKKKAELVISAFIPNYRLAAKLSEKNREVFYQLSFYRLARNEVRLVLIRKEERQNLFFRTLIALRKKQTDKRLNNWLEKTKSYLELHNESLPEYEDVSPELNPNFSLQ
jgi:hypothetical protein